MASLSKGTSFTDGVTGDVTAAKLHALVDAATPVGGFVTDRTAKTSVVGADLVLVSDSADSNNLKKVTVTNLANNLPTARITTGTIDTATLGTTTGTLATFTSATITNGTITTGLIPTATLGTTTGTAATFTSATLTTGVIPTGTFGTTTSTAATITTGTIPTLTVGTSTSTAATVTNGTVTTLNSTTGTITNLSTTLAGDFTISQGTGTVGTRVAVVNAAQEYSRTHNFDATTLTITSGTVPWNLAENQVAKLTVTTNSTMNNPTNAVDGATYMLVVTQGTSGSNTLSFGTAYKFPGGTVPSLSTGSSQVDVLAFTTNGTLLFGVSSQNFS